MGSPFPFVLTALVLSQPAAPRKEESQTLPEYVTKSKIIRLLLDYVDWPSGSASRPLIVGVLEPSPFGSALDQAFGNATIKGRPVQLRLLRGPAQLSACDVVFIPENFEGSIEGVVRLLRGKPILTIADSPGFAQRGIVVNLVLQETRIRLEVNVPAMKGQGIAISPQVLKNATLVD